MQPDSVSPEELVREILRVNHRLVTCKSEGHDQSVMAMGMSDGDGTEEGENEESMGDPDADPQEGSRLSNKDQVQMLQEVIILDCQPPTDFHDAHIRGAVNVTFPAIMVRRIAAGKIDLFDKSKELKAKMANAKMVFVVYDSHSPSSSEAGAELSDLVSMVAKKLAQSGCRVATLKGRTVQVSYLLYFG